jgi:hypothetical protein
MPDLAEVDRISQQRVQRTARKWIASRAPAILRDATLGDDSVPIEGLFQQPDAAQFEVSFIKVANQFRFLRINDELVIADIITERTVAAHPHTFLL